MAPKLLALMVLAATIMMPGGECAPTLRFEVPADHPDRWFVELSNSGDRCARELTVYAAPAGITSTDGLPALLGRHEKTAAQTIRFTPQFAPAGAA